MELHCDIHSWMTGYLLVLDHPFFTTTATDGSFEIKDVPAGEPEPDRLAEQGRLCQPGLGRGMPVTVKAGETTDVGEIKIDPGQEQMTTPVGVTGLADCSSFWVS